MPAAIELAMVIQGRSRSGCEVFAAAKNMEQETVFSLDRLKPPAEAPDWTDYLKGVCWALKQAGYFLGGADLTIESTIPIGAGLSSSAALELAAAAVLSSLAEAAIPLPELARLCQKAENEFVGVRCGIMDQYAVALSRAGQALLLDCRSLEYSYIPLELGSCCLMIIDSRVKRSLSASAYNRRREECAEATILLSRFLGRRLESLREVSLDEVREARSILPSRIYRRSRYIIEENMRVLKSAEALRSGDLPSFGYFMTRSHAGLRDLYQVSCSELDLIVETANATKGVLGARMTGAGFGGCAVALLEKSVLEELSAKLRHAFSRNGWLSPDIYVTSAAPGLQIGG
jgi:galactokinase